MTPIDVNLKNFTEILVDDALKKLWPQYDGPCDCERCKLDVKAIALNNLQPKYTVTTKGEVYTKLNSFRSQVDADITKEILKAMNIVKANPSHEIK